MPRTTLDIDAPLLKELKRLGKEQGVSMGKIVSRLLARALGDEEPNPEPPRFHWTSKPMTALVDLADKEAVYAALDRDKE